MPAHVVVIGGGMAGLSVAYELTRAGVSFTLLEQRSRLGGVVLSEQVEEFVLDAGPDSLLVQKPEAIALCEEVGLGDRLVPTTPPRIAYIQRAGRLHALPAGSVLGIPTAWTPFLESRLFTWPGKMRMGLELLVPAKKNEEDESIGAFMRRRFGREATDYLAEPLLAGIHAGDVDRLSLRALFPRFVDAERTYGSLLRAFRQPAASRARASESPPTAGVAHATSGSRHTMRDGAFRSLPNGLSELVDAVTQRLPRPSLLINQQVSAITRERSRYRVWSPSGESFTADAVVFASPAFATARIVREFDPRLAEACDAIPYASAATVVMGFERSAIAHPLGGSGFVVPRVEGTGILAGSWLSSKWPHRAPTGHVLLRTFLGGARDPEALELTDRAMIERSMKALTPLLGVSKPPHLTRVYRWERANAQHEVGHHARLQAVERALSTHAGLFATGSAYRGVGIPDCVADGRATGRHVAAWLRDRPQRDDETDNPRRGAGSAHASPHI